MPEVGFDGVAPIPKDTHVRMLVDDAENPKKAFWVYDARRETTYVNWNPSTAKGARAFAAAAGDGTFVDALVHATRVFANGTSRLTVTILKKATPSAREALLRDVIAEAGR